MTENREPIFNIPGAVVVLIALLIGLFGIGDRVFGEVWLIEQLAFIPGRFAMMFGIDLVAAAEDAAAGSENGRQLVAVAQYLAIEGDTKPWTLATYALLHGSWAHVLLNSVWLLAFGSAVARRFGAVRFLVLMVLCAVGGALGHLATHLTDVVPMVGASASVSGAMAAALRFAFQPGAPLGIYRLDEHTAYRLPALPLRDVLAERRAATFVIVWFVLNMASGLAAPGLGMVDSAIAWQAHVGGFIVGLLAFPLLDPVPRGPDA
ncbi:rhomboid family intramembrane serine protease [Alsobacter sp. R-9]